MMKHRNLKKMLCLIGCMVLSAAMALSFTGCGSATAPEAAPPSETTEAQRPAETETPTEAEGSTEGSSPAETVSAEAVTSFTVEVTDLDGNVTTQELISDKATIGEALQEKGILEGEEGPYGLYIKAVNGIELDWDTHQKYWAFYVDGEYALAGADQTELIEGAVYSFKPEG